MPAWIIAAVAAAYLGLLFAIAYRGDKAAAVGHSLIANPYVYSLSLAVYATAWTFYGSVGRAADSGIGFLPIYLGPTVMAALWWVVLRKIIRIAKDNRITSLADFISSRYGKSAALAGLVTVIAVVGVIPYVSLQLKAISTSFNVLRGYPDILPLAQKAPEAVLGDTAFYVALILAAFTIVFGTRHLDAAERHEGMVAAIAFESLVKLLAFLAVGIFVTWGMYDGLADLFARASEVPRIAEVFIIGGGSSDVYHNWASLFSLAFLSMLAIMFLPRQFQVAVVENVDEAHLNKAIWLFPLYLLLFNLFVLPIAIGGLLHFGDGAVNPDTFVLTLPMSGQQEALALLVFIGGVSAATGMVIVESIALSTMVCNDLVMPALLRIKALHLAEREDLSGLLLAIRRGTIVVGLLLGYAYYRLAGEAYALVSIGLISFAAVAQFAPALLGGIYWKGGTRAGALAGLGAGFLVWAYTLMLPAFARSGWLPMDLLEQGPFAIALLRPLSLFGLEGLDEISHAILWSMLANVGAYLTVSILSDQSEVEQTQATLFVDVFKHDRGAERVWRVSGSLPDLYALLARFLGAGNAKVAFTAYARPRGRDWPQEIDAELARYCEAQLAGVIGAASARVMLATVVEEELLRDSLTGLPNRALLLSRLGDALDRIRLEAGRGFALLFLNLDRFRVITDSLGAAAGDQLLIAVAQRLDASLRPGDTVARVGGENFAILLDEAREEGEAVRFADKLQATLAAGFNIEGHELFTSASIGIAIGRASYVDPGDILRDADTASHSALERGGAYCEVFAADMRQRVVALLDMETELRQAVLKGQQFQVFYQPIVELRTGTLAGFEALVRMRRPDGSLVQPGDFIPLTEETGLIVHIGRWVLGEACRQMRDWQLKYPRHSPLQMSVNLAGRQFIQPDLMQQIETVLQETGLDTHSLKLEVTETVIMEHAEAAAAVLEQLRAMGVKLLMDDFGTGYSSLSYLHRFPVNTLKIDASFVRRMDVDRKNADIIQTIATLGHTLGMDLIAEGVESEGQLAQLRGLGVEYGQGYYFSRPLDAAAAEQLIASGRCW
ncbi:EAL domain-containing protein [Pseudomonas cavernicola]|uniref:EAL domain-containing protein n=1 Tax=Pseudomonas cavernicola TaxID=2320866 RepID=A0A418X875_9PSED|nr:EAL domain-containing protein [Pseudomonas cavernicola]RJG08667.1 EAL domain-containing protein [Pseudomonas cavernicola]